LLEEYRRSDLTQKDFAAEAGIGLSTFHAWLRRDQADGKAGNAQFVSLPGLGLPAAAAPMYRLELPSRVILEIPSGFRAEELARLVEVLRSL
jgi:hypothetical protein